MKKLILTASAIALIPAAAHAQLLGGGLGGGLGGTLGGTLDSTIGLPLGPTLDRTTRTVRGTVDGTVATEGDQSVDAREGRVSANRSASGSIAGSTASLADLPVPALGNMVSGSASGSANGQGNANAQLIGTNAISGAIAPLAGQSHTLAGDASAQANSTISGVANAAAMPGFPAFAPLAGGPAAAASGNGQGNGAASLTSAPLAVAGSAASAAQGAATVTPGMPVMTPDGASLGRVREIVADGRGQVQQVVVKQGNVTRSLPAGMFSASGNALIAGQAEGSAESSNNAERAESEGSAAN